VFQTVRYIRGQEPSIGISQEVIDAIPARDRAIVLQCIDVVVVGANTQFRFQKTRSNKHQCRRKNQLDRLRSNEQTALIRPTSDLNDSSLKRGFIQVSGTTSVAVRAARNQRVGSGTQDNVRRRRSGHQQMRC
jgi:hypothetical protein